MGAYQRSPTPPSTTRIGPPTDPWSACETTCCHFAGAPSATSTRAGGVDYDAFEERVAGATAAVKQGVHQVALSGLDVDLPFIPLWGKADRRVHRIVRTYGSLARRRCQWNARCIASSARQDLQRALLVITSTSIDLDNFS